MTRFEMELSGKLGDYWKRDAEAELKKVAGELKNGEITIDENGVARNCIGRVLMSDMAEKVAYITDKIDRKATEAARDEEVARELEIYKANAKPYTAEQIAEMRAAFGEGKTIVNLLTGQKITL